MAYDPMLDLKFERLNPSLKRGSLFWCIIIEAIVVVVVIFAYMNTFCLSANTTNSQSNSRSTLLEHRGRSHLPQHAATNP